jgi:CheY-like chemotaxis protein
MELIRGRAVGKRLPLKLHQAGPVPREMLTDPTRLKQILVNLLGNAIKFTETGYVELVLASDVNHQPPRIQFEVCDTGIGMTDEQLSRLFEPFTQADSSTTRKFGGTGLGLTISRRLARMMDGDITVQSRPDEGSCFTVTIAVQTEQPVEWLSESAGALSLRSRSGLQDPGGVPIPPPSFVANDELAGFRVLLVEDGPDNQRLIEHVLRRAGAEVTLANDGQEGVTIALQAFERSRAFDVILMDMQMPVMDGYEAARHLRDEGYELPIVALTAHAMKGDRDKCLNFGCNDYTPKPIDRQQLIRQVACWSRLARQSADETSSGGVTRGTAP